MRHFFLSHRDYAGSGHALARALMAVGEDVRSWTVSDHEYEYPHYPELLGKLGAKWPRWVDACLFWCDWFWIIQSDLPRSMGGYTGGSHGNRSAWLDKIQHKRCAIVHGGGYFRENRETFRKLWEPYIRLSLCYEADLMGSFSPEYLVIPPVNAGEFPRNVAPGTRLRVGHFPSRPEDKGSEHILPALMNRADIDFATSVRYPVTPNGVDRVPWGKQLQRMAACDVIVDQIKPEIRGFKFGEWVSIATEAAACGCISIANSLDPQPYIDTYGVPPGIHVCNTIDALTDEIDRLANAPRQQVENEKRASYEWVQEHHSLEATGVRLAKWTREAA